MIHALARAAGILDHPEYLHRAQHAVSFLLERLRRGDGRLLHCWCRGEAKLDAYLDDYAYLIQALVTLYEADFDARWIEAAVPLAEMVLRHFHDERQGGFFFTADDHERLITAHQGTARRKCPGKQRDGGHRPDPARQADRPRLVARRRAAGGRVGRPPDARGARGDRADADRGGPARRPDLGTGAAGRPRSSRYARDSLGDAPDVSAALRGGLPPAGPHAPSDATLNELFAGKTAAAGEPALYVCENFACQQPARGTAAILATCQRLAGAG